MRTRLIFFPQHGFSRQQGKRCPITTQVKPYIAPEKVGSGREFAIAVARLAAHTRCHDVVILDVTHISSVTDFFVIATGTSIRQMRTVCDEAAEMGTKLNYKPYRLSGYEGEHWIAVDFVDVVLHLFDQESRLYYDLEGLWGDAPKIDFPKT